MIPPVEQSQRNRLLSYGCASVEDNRTIDNRPSMPGAAVKAADLLPNIDIVRQGMHPNLGPGSEDQSRGQRESVLGKEIGVDDAYTRKPMSNLVAALSTKRTIDDVIKVRCEAKLITNDASECPDARIVPAPRRCIQARSGTISEQKEHRSTCHNEECIIAFRIHGLWSERPGQAAKRDRSSRGLNPHAIEFTPSDTVGLINPRSSARTPSHHTPLLGMGPKVEAEAKDAEENDAEGNDAKAIQDAESSSLADPTVTLSSGVALSGVKDGVAKTDVRAAKTDEPTWSDPKRSELRLPCNFGEEGDEPNLQDEDHEVGRNFEEEIAWQHHLDSMEEDRVMKTIAEQALAEAKARAETQVPDFVKAVKQGKGQSATWFDGSKAGMVFKTGAEGLGYYKVRVSTVIKLTPELRPMQNCTRMQIMISDLVDATAKEAKEEAPKTSPAPVKQRLTARSTRANGPGGPILG